MREMYAEEVQGQLDQKMTLDRRWIAAPLAALLAFVAFAGCDVERRKSDAELGLNPQQAAGRKIYDNYCDRCHRPYSTKGKKVPGLEGRVPKQISSADWVARQ